MLRAWSAHVFLGLFHLKLSPSGSQILLLVVEHDRQIACSPRDSLPHPMGISVLVADLTRCLYPEPHRVCIGLRNKQPSVQSARRVRAGLLGCLVNGIDPLAL